MTNVADSPVVTPFLVRARFLTAAAVMLAITLFLGIFAWQTANPVVISPAQIELADDVIVGRVLATGENRIQVARVFKGSRSEGEEVRVVNLPDGALRQGSEYLLALSPFRRDAQVTVLKITVLNDRGVAPPEVLIYPATPEAFERVKRILRQGT